MLVDPMPTPAGTLRGHIARANPQSRASGEATNALAIFLGPDSYVSPSWYATKRETGKVVPTWNYVAIHAHGRLTWFDDRQRLLALVTQLTAAHESSRSEPWAVSDAPTDYVDAMLDGIIGFELSITRLEGAWKMSQNRSADDRAGVVRGLNGEDGAEAAAVARIMASNETL
jgi:transcriptional regulator